MGLVPLLLFLGCALVVRNMAVIDPFEERQAEDKRRLSAGEPPKTNRRRRESLGVLAGRLAWEKTAPTPGRFEAKGKVRGPGAAVRH